MAENNKTVELLRLMSLLCGQPRRWRVVEMADALKINKRNIYRYLIDLARFIPLTEERGQYWVEGETLLNSLNFNPTELSTILLCLNSVTDASLREEMATLVERIRQSLARSREKHLATLTERIAQPATLVEAGEHLRQVTDALATRRRLRVTYQSRERDEPVERDLDPIAMWYHDHGWYFRAFDHLSGTQRNFRVSRLHSVEETEETFEPYDYDPEALRYERWDNPHGGERVRVVVEVTPELARWLAENPPHSTQELSECRWTVHVSDPPRMVSWLAGLRGCRVVEPESLREALREHARQLLDD